MVLLVLDLVLMYQYIQFIRRTYDMSYLNNKAFIYSTTSQPSGQTISTTYQEITGSRCNIDFSGNTANILYKCSFYSRYIYTTSNNWSRLFLHCKLQKSNDDFSSNIVDITGSQYNFSSESDTSLSRNGKWEISSPFFIIENLDSKYLRLVIRSYSTSHKGVLHDNQYYDGSTNPAASIRFDPSLIVMEL